MLPRITIEARNIDMLLFMINLFKGIMLINISRCAYCIRLLAIQPESITHLVHIRPCMQAVRR